MYLHLDTQSLHYIIHVIYIVLTTTSLRMKKQIQKQSHQAPSTPIPTFQRQLLICLCPESLRAHFLQTGTFQSSTRLIVCAGSLGGEEIVVWLGELREMFSCFLLKISMNLPLFNNSWTFKSTLF